MPGTNSTFTHDTTTAKAAAPEGDVILGRYRVLGTTGSGGFGSVLTCWDTRLQRRIAIKRMPLVTQGNTASNASTLSEALREARMTSLLTHPNIVVVHDFETDDRFAYLVMEYVDGISLLEMLARVEGGTLTTDECAYLVRSLEGALSYAHENHVLHLDIKPSNIMIDHTGTVKLCDFGMATLASAAGFGDSRGGTVGYMAPEQITGDLVDERADVFSLAVVVWQALTGENPFAAPTAEESLAKIKRGPRTPLSRTVPQAAGMAEEAIMAALEPNPAMRTASVRAFADEVVFGLGDPDAGASSIAHLMGQTPEKDDEEPVWEGDRLPLAWRHPHAVGTVVRAATAVATGVVCLRVLPHLLAGLPAWTSPAGTLLAAGLAALWPPLGSLVAGVCLAFSIGAGGGGAASVMLPALIIAALIVWWVAAGRHERLSSLCALLPALTWCPVAGVAPAALCLEPLPALVTATGAALAPYLLQDAIASGFNASATAAALLTRLTNPSVVVVCLGAGIAATLGALLTRKGRSTGFGVFGQLLALALAIFALCLSARMKNDGIWSSPNWGWVAVAVLLCALFCVIVILRGPLAPDGEDVIRQ